VNSEGKVVMENIRASRNIMYKVSVDIQRVLQRAKGKRSNTSVGFLEIHPMRVSRYEKRYNSDGMEALVREPKKGPVRTDAASCSRRGLSMKGTEGPRFSRADWKWYWRMQGPV
jgi:hypothetical protein